MTHIYINNRYSDELGLPYFFQPDVERALQFLWVAEFLGSRFASFDSGHRKFFLENAGKRLLLRPDLNQGPGWWIVEAIKSC